MKYCIYCGKQIKEEDAFCPYCGHGVKGKAPIASTAPTVPPTPHAGRVTCPRCGSPDIHFVTTQASQNFSKEDACCGYLLCGPLGLLFGMNDKTESKTVRKCMYCNHEF